MTSKREREPIMEKGKKKKSKLTFFSDAAAAKTC
jgi:hypothetical protein